MNTTHAVEAHAETSMPKAWAKAVAVLWANLAALPFVAAYWLSVPLLGRNRALEDITQGLALWPGLSGCYVRRATLAWVTTHCHRSAEVSFGTLFSQVGVRIDENVYIGPRCQLGLVHIERDCLIAAGVHIPSGGQTHAIDNPNIPIKDQGGTRQLVTIGAGAWIGSCAVILADVGAGTVVGAGAVVTKPLPAHVIAAGVPAKVIRPRFDNGPADDKTSQLSPAPTETRE